MSNKLTTQGFWLCCATALLRYICIVLTPVAHASSGVAGHSHYIITPILHMEQLSHRETVLGQLLPSHPLPGQPHPHPKQYRAAQFLVVWESHRFPAQDKGMVIRGGCPSLAALQLQNQEPKRWPVRARYLVLGADQRQAFGSWEPIRDRHTS